MPRSIAIGRDGWVHIDGQAVAHIVTEHPQIVSPATVIDAVRSRLRPGADHDAVQRLLASVPPRLNAGAGADGAHAVRLRDIAHAVRSFPWADDLRAAADALDRLYRDRDACVDEARRALTAALGFGMPAQQADDIRAALSLISEDDA